MKIIGYTFEAACHCPACTHKALLAGFLRSDPLCLDLDEHGIPLNLVDREWNEVRPIFTTDEVASSEYCDDCLSPLLDA